ncbi:MAG TPA: roadblock/LC7 domain-containing protein [Gemmatimonadales bacterium]|jgi:predicted regulator of Ras-like GTPase activity (Roadblock/LC7/MglB family)
MPTIRDVVQALARRRGVKAAIVLGRDGLPIDSASTNGLDSDNVAAVVPALVSACAGVGDAVGCGAFDTGVVEYEGGLALITAVTPDALLALIIDPRINVGSLLFEIRRHRPAIAKLL